MKTEIFEILRGLSSAEKIELAQDLWDSVGEEALELTDDQRAELNRRIQDLQDNPGGDIPWEDVKADLLKKL